MRDKIKEIIKDKTEDNDDECNTVEKANLHGVVPCINNDRIPMHFTSNAAMKVAFSFKRGALDSKMNILDDFIDINTKTLQTYSYTIHFLKDSNQELEVPSVPAASNVLTSTSSKKKRKPEFKSGEINLMLIYCHQMLFFFNYYLTLLEGVELFEDSYFINGILISAAPLGCLLSSSIITLFSFTNAYIGYIISIICGIVGSILYCTASTNAIWGLFLSRFIFGLSGVMILGQNYLQAMNKSMLFHSTYNNFLIMPILGMSIGQLCMSVIQQFSEEIFNINDRVAISVIVILLWAIYGFYFIFNWKSLPVEDSLSVNEQQYYGMNVSMSTFATITNYLTIVLSKLILDSLLSIAIYLILDIPLEEIGYFLTGACIMSLIPVFGTKWLISDISHGSLYLLSYALLLLSIGGIILFSPKNLIFLGVLCIAIMSAQQLEMLSLSL
jgi:hypothetical protein